MIVRLDDLRRQPIDLDLPIELGPLSYQAGLAIDVAGAGFKGLVEPTADGLRCSGHVTATAMVPCSRCLESYALPVDRSVDVSYVLGRPDSGDEVQISREDLDVSFLRPDRTLDLREVVAEQIYLELPMKPLCSDACRGLCPGCGANLNRESCTCRASA